MLLILFLVYSFAKRTEAERNGDALGFRSTSDTCDCNIDNCRRLFDIVWGCLTTIFACTWVSVHPNVPPPNTSRLGLLLRRLKLMLMAVIAPEVMVNFAARQFVIAHRFSKEFGISITHGFFICMGGFVTKDPSTGGPGYPIVTREQLQHPEYLAAIQEVKAADIEDKSKGDALSKAVALVQGVWFIAQCIARFAQRLPMTELEVATLAFAVVNVFVWFLWWGKPLDVQEPISVGPMKEVPATAIQAAPRLDLWDQSGGIFHGDYADHDPCSSSSVPAFWSDCEDGTGEYPFYAELLVGTVFGAIHCLVWNADLTSFMEKWMWRSSALVVAVVPFLIMSSLWVGMLSGRETPMIFTLCFLIFVYIIGRLFLLVLPFTALRALPAGAFIDVDWSVYIPHL